MGIEENKKYWYVPSSLSESVAKAHGIAEEKRVLVIEFRCNMQHLHREKSSRICP